MRVDGNWQLEVSTPFGKHPATLVLEWSAGGEPSGRIESQMGTVPLREVELAPDGFRATAAMDFRGRTYEAKINGSVEGERLSGTIKVNIPIAPPARFTGTRG